MAASESAELLPATRRALLRRVAVGQAEGRTPSLVGAVVRDGSQAWWGSRSMLEDHEPDGNIQYRIGSLTKMFVAVLIMRLRADGLIDLDDPVDKYLDLVDLGVAGSATIAQLLSHTAGLAAESRGPWWERTPGELRPELADILADQPRPLPAGRQFHYSNPGFALLGALAGRLRGHSWDEAVRREILTPLGMARTTLRAQPPHAGGFAVHPWADTMQPEPTEHTGHMAPAGDLWSTADDLCRFAAFLLNGDDRVLPAATLAEMRAPAAPPAGGAGYGLGIQVAERAERTLFGHGGSMPGFLATLWVSPDDGLGAVTLANATAGPAIGEIAADLIDIVASHEPRLPERWKPQPGIGADLLALTGLWYWGPRATVLRVLSRDMIELAPVTGPGRASRFRAAADGTWTGLDGYYTGETLRVVPAADGVAAHLDLGTFVFTREPYGPGSPAAARPHADGWQAG